MKKLQSKKNRILLSLLLCVSLAITGVFACPWDSDCNGPNTCHTWESEDGPVLHHIGPPYIINEHGTIESDHPTYCPGEYRILHYSCEYCGEVFADINNPPTPHDLVLQKPDPHDVDTWYWECNSCGYITYHAA